MRPEGLQGRCMMTSWCAATTRWASSGTACGFLAGGRGAFTSLQGQTESACAHASEPGTKIEAEAVQQSCVGGLLWHGIVMCEANAGVLG